jgi:hypothetical protein
VGELGIKLDGERTGDEDECCKDFFGGGNGFSCCGGDESDGASLMMVSLGKVPQSSSCIDGLLWTSPSPTNPLLPQQTDRQAVSRNVQSLATSKKDKPTTKPASQVHRLLPSELPDDIGGLQVQFCLLVVIKNAHQFVSIECDEYSCSHPLGSHRSKASLSKSI